MVIEHAHESEHRPFVSKVNMMAKDLQLYSQLRAIINRDVDYITQLKCVVDVAVY